MKNSFKKVAFVLVLLGIVFWFISSRVNEQKLKSEKEALSENRHIETTKIISAMVTKYNAISDWRKSFEGRLSFLYPNTYTIDLQDALINTDGRPILFFSNLNDVARNEKGYLLYFGDWFGILRRLRGLDIYFVLECTAEQADKIVTHPKGYEDFAVIAQITNIEKVRFQLDLTGESFGTEQNVFIATGSCLDFVFVGDYQQQDFIHNELLGDTLP